MVLSSQERLISFCYHMLSLEPSIGQYLSGLGKKVNRPILMQLCLLFIILSVHAGNHTIAVVKGMEDY